MNYKNFLFSIPIISLFTLILTSELASAQITHHMTLNADQPKEVINRHIYGHFAEHLGRGIYDGIWTYDSSGDITIREDVVEALKAIKIPNLRWPGGCFADYYFWKDGIGPREERPSIVNALWGGVTEDNSVGTHEFMELVEILDTEPIIVGNVGSGTVREMAQWWEYMIHPGPSPMADLRKENGREAPWDVRYWGVGNESWGCGGSMRPEFYANQFRRFSTFLHGYGGAQPYRIAAGAAGSDYNWTEVMMRDAGQQMDGLDIHHYTILGSWETHKGHATDYTEAEWFELLERTYEWVELLDNHIAIMDKYDPEKRVDLIIGEWGTWHEPLEGSNPGFLHQQQTIRDALSASTTLDIFHRYLDRVKMANIAQTVNVLQAMILTEGDEMILTPTYHVFDFYTVHHDASYLDFDLDGGEYRFGDNSIPAVTSTASRNSEGVLHITLTNLDPNQNRTVEIDVRGESISGVSGRILTADEINSHNTFEHPDTVSPADFTGATVTNGNLTVDLPAKSLVVLMLK